jgi:hypothetical protein
VRRAAPTSRRHFDVRPARVVRALRPSGRARPLAPRRHCPPVAQQDPPPARQPRSTDADLRSVQSGASAGRLMAGGPGALGEATRAATAARAGAIARRHAARRRPRHSSHARQPDGVFPAEAPALRRRFVEARYRPFGRSRTRAPGSCPCRWMRTARRRRAARRCRDASPALDLTPHHQYNYRRCTWAAGGSARAERSP